MFKGIIVEYKGTYGIALKFSSNKKATEIPKKLKKKKTQKPKTQNHACSK